MAQTKIKTLDGRTLEGGGQLVRVAIALSALTDNQWPSATSEETAKKEV